MMQTLNVKLPQYYIDCGCIILRLSVGCSFITNYRSPNFVALFLLFSVLYFDTLYIEGSEYHIQEKSCFVSIFGIGNEEVVVE